MKSSSAPLIAKHQNEKYEMQLSLLLDVAEYKIVSGERNGQFIISYFDIRFLW